MNKAIISLTILLLILQGVFNSKLKNFRIFPNTDYPGNDFNSFTTNSLNDCRNACQSDSICAAFTFNPQTRLCWMKTMAGNSSYAAGAVSGLRS